MAELEDVVRELQEIKRVLENDRSMMWKVLLVTIGGAFALIGVRLVFP